MNISPGCRIVGRYALYNSTMTLAVTPPHVDSGSPSKGTRPVQIFCPKAAQNIFFTLFSTPYFFHITFNKLF